MLLLRSRNRSQPSATFRNHPQPFATVRAILLYGRAYDKFCRRGAFWRFQTSLCFLSRGGRCTSWHSDVFCNVSKVVLCGKRNTFLRRFHKMRCSFRGRRSTLGMSIVILRGRRNTLDVSCCVFFGNRIGRAASSGDKAQIPWQAWHFLRCAENWRKPRTKHRFWNSKISGSWENSRKTSILMLQSVKIGGSLARNARFGAPTRLVWSLWFSCGVAVSMGEAAKPLLFEGCHAGCHVVLRGRRGTL